MIFPRTVWCLNSSAGRTSLDAFLKMFGGYNILEQYRTGVTALERGGMPAYPKPPQEVRSVSCPRQA